MLPGRRAQTQQERKQQMQRNVCLTKMSVEKQVETDSLTSLIAYLPVSLHSTEESV